MVAKIEIKINYNSIYNIFMFPPLFDLFIRLPDPPILRGTILSFFSYSDFFAISPPFLNVITITYNSWFPRYVNEPMIYVLVYPYLLYSTNGPEATFFDDFIVKIYKNAGSIAQIGIVLVGCK